SYIFFTLCLYFFFSSRRRHTRFSRDWSSDVCSSDLLHTRIDYYAERMFFIHRFQHLVLHHLGPLLIMGAYPGQVLRAGLPMAWRSEERRVGKEGRSWGARDQ